MHYEKAMQYVQMIVMGAIACIIALPVVVGYAVVESCRWISKRYRG